MSHQNQDGYWIPNKTTEANILVCEGALKCANKDYEGALKGTKR